MIIFMFLYRPETLAMFFYGGIWTIPGGQTCESKYGVSACTDSIAEDRRGIHFRLSEWVGRDCE